jgi:tetratricopeptide (TPR) repeat protein
MRISSRSAVTSAFLFISIYISGCTKKETSPPAAEMTKIDQLLAIAKQNPSYDNYVFVGLEFEAQNKHLEAIENYKKALEINPNAPIAYNNICASFNNLARFADAAYNCEKSIALDPNLELAQNNLKVAKEGLVELKKTVKEKNKDWKSRKGLKSEDLIAIGLDYFNVRELDSAIEVWNRIKEGDPMYAMAQNNLASSYILQKKLGPAEKAINQALKLEPENGLFLNNKKWLEDVRAEKK